MAEKPTSPLYSEKTAALNNTLSALNIKNAQAMKLLDGTNDQENKTWLIRAK